MVLAVLCWSSTANAAEISSPILTWGEPNNKPFLTEIKTTFEKENPGNTVKDTLIPIATFWDYLAVSGSLEGRFIEHVAHLHEQFKHPVNIKNGRYMPPETPGFSIDFVDGVVADYEYPVGRQW